MKQSATNTFRLIVLNSGSSGNGYILTNGSDTLLIEAGCRYKEMLAAINYDISTVNGMVVSHEHNDHAKYVEQYLNKGLFVHMPNDMKKNLYLSHVYNANIIQNGVTYELGNFKVVSFKLEHSVTCYGYYIYHRCLGKLLFITDTEYVKYNFKKLAVDHILVEANYSKNVLHRADVNSTHVLQGHMEIETTLEFLRKNDTENLKNVVLLHLSDKNSDEQKFKELTIGAVHKGVNVSIANKGLIVPL